VKGSSLEKLRRIGAFLVRASLLGLGLFVRALRTPKLKIKGTVLLIRVDALGDFVVFAPAMAAIRKRYEDCHIVVVVWERIAALARSCPYVDDVISVDPKKYRHNPLYALSILRCIQRLQSAVCINTMYSRNIMSEEIALWSHSKSVLGWRGEWKDSLACLKPGYDLTYSVLLEDAFSLETPELYRHEALLAALGGESGKLVPQLWSVEPLRMEHSSRRVVEALREDKSIILVPGSESPTRQWPPACYAEIVDRFRTDYPSFRVLLVGSEKDRQVAIENSARNGLMGVQDLRGETSSLELTQLINGSSLVVGNETGPLHIAIALGVPTVCILGGGHYGRFMPYGDPRYNQVVTNRLECFGCDWNCKRSRVECIVDISVDKVWKAVGMVFRRTASG
jgi:ADP-heptose:LPS heptosyltransferase